MIWTWEFTKHGHFSEFNHAKIMGFGPAKNIFDEAMNPFEPNIFRNKLVYNTNKIGLIFFSSPHRLNPQVSSYPEDMNMYPLVMTTTVCYSIWPSRKFVDLPIDSMVIFHSELWDTLQHFIGSAPKIHHGPKRQQGSVTSKIRHSPFPCQPSQ